MKSTKGTPNYWCAIDFQLFLQTKGCASMIWVYILASGELFGFNWCFFRIEYLSYIETHWGQYARGRKRKEVWGYVGQFALTLGFISHSFSFDNMQKKFVSINQWSAMGKMISACWRDRGQFWDKRCGFRQIVILCFFHHFALCIQTNAQVKLRCAYLFPKT